MQDEKQHEGAPRYKIWRNLEGGDPERGVRGVRGHQRPEEAFSMGQTYNPGIFR